MLVNTKKIWILAITFGFMTTVLFYMLTSTNGNIDQKASPPPPVEEEEETNHEGNTLPIEAGKRAISLAVDDVQSVSGFVRPGSYVDVIAVLPVEEARQPQIILKNIEVLAVGKTINDEETETQEPYQMVTLEVTPSEGATLAVAKDVGVLTLMLRGNEEETTSSNVKISVEQLTKGTMPQ